jgi:integrase
VAGLLRCIRIIVKYSLRKGYLRESPFAFRPVGSWVRITPVKQRRYLTSDEVRRILDTMEADITSTAGWDQWRARRLFAVTATCAYGGFRMSEAFRLHVADLDLTTGVIIVDPRSPLKTARSARLVPCPPRLVQILSDWLPHRMDAPPGFLDADALQCPWLFPGVTRRGYWHDGPGYQKPLYSLQSVAARAGVAHATFAMFRHSWATQAEYLGVPGAGIQRILGHTTELTSLRNYRHSVAKNLTDTVARFDY